MTTTRHDLHGRGWRLDRRAAVRAGSIGMASLAGLARLAAGPALEKDPQALKDGYRALIPVNRWGIPSDLDGSVVFLASEASSFVTGQTLHVNGGLTVC